MGTVPNDRILVVELHHITPVGVAVGAAKGRGARGDYLHHSEARLEEGPVHRFLQTACVECRPTRDVGRAGGLRQVGDVEWMLQVPPGRGTGGGTGRRRRAHLPAGHAVDEIVGTNHGDVHISPGGMDEVIATDGDQIAVTREDNHLEAVVRQLEPGGKG